MTKKKLIIVDSHFKSYSGHNFFYNTKLVKILNKDFKIKILANRNIKIKDKISVQVKKYFEDYFELKENKFSRILKNLNFLKKVKFIQYLNDKKIEFINKSNKSSLSGYKKKIRKIFKEKSDLIFFHSEIGNKFHDIINALVFSSDDFSNKNIYLVDRIGTFQNKLIIQIIKYLSLKKNIFFLTDSHNIKKIYKKNKISINLLPLFPQYSQQYIKKKFNENLNISLYVGPARKEKGFLDIPNLIKKIIKIKKINLNLNYSLDPKNSEKKIDYILNQINEFDVLIQKIAMKEDQYIKYFQGIDILIMNYKSNSYSDERTSTIFFDAITNFVIPIVKNNTWMSSLIKKNKILNKLIIKNDNEITDTILIIKKNRMKFLNEIKSFRSQILKVNDPNNLNNIFKIKKIKSNPYKTLLYLNKNFLLKKDNRIVNGNNFHLVKKYNFKSKSFDIIHLINKILLRSEFNKHLNVTKILNEKNFNEDFLHKKNLQIGLFKLKIFTKKSLFLNYHRSIAQFLLTNKQINNVYTLMKI